MKAFLISVEKVKSNIEEISKSLDQRTIERGNRYIKENDKFLHLAAAYLVKNHLPGKIKYTEHGKPYIEGGPYFSLSHSGGYAGLVIDENPVGIDIEKASRIVSDGVRRKIFGNRYEKNIDYLYSWCRKEAISKAFGLGLAMDYPSIDDKEGKITINQQELGVKTITYSGHVISLAVFSKNIDTIEIIED